MSAAPDQTSSIADNAPWYAGVTRSMWLVLAVASAGWIFDVYEGQIFNITRTHMLGSILDASGSAPAGESVSPEAAARTAELVKLWGDRLLGVFLLGGTLGGIAFGSLADRFGRRPIMILTILMYSIFSGLTYFATTMWQVAVLRFLVAMGVGGEWAVAAALVSEVFPPKARAHASGIFHASSVIGTWMAAIAGMLVGPNWRYAYLVGVLPALLILWVRASVDEPEQWQSKKAVVGADSMGRLRDLFGIPEWRHRALLGLALAAVGLGTFWAVTVAGQDLAREMLLHEGASKDVATTKSQFAYGIVQTAGGGLGLLSFGPLCARWGRRKAFIVFQLLALVIVPITCFVPTSYNQLLCLLPLYGFLTMGMHAGYAIYFPELFPTQLRATATSVCFNGGRMVASSMLLFSAWLKARPGFNLPWAITSLSTLFLLGVVIAWAMPETRARELPE
ncbi:MAG TPA: MFS transporter [Caulifigura sp.]|jgi:MFS family permease|nr:MFS transporter [Caulifigura sp.]